MRSLIITKLVLEGETYKRTLGIDKSLVIIKGDGFSGKSLFLKLIDYCLGSKSETIDLSVQTELAQYCDNVFIEIKINDKFFTFKRNLKNEKNIVEIYLSPYEYHKEYSPWKKRVDELSDFLVNELGISLHTILRRKQRSKDLNPEKISFRDIMRFVFVKQSELGSNQFLDNNNSFVVGKNKEVFKIINDLVIPDIEEIEREIQLKQNEFNRLETVNNGLEDYLSKRDALIFAELSNTRDSIETQIYELKLKKKEIVEEHKNNKNDLYYQLVADINELDTTIINCEKDRSNLLLSIKNKKLLLSEYEDEFLKLEATLETMKKIKIVDHKERCPLCNSFVPLARDEEGQCDDVEKAVEQLKSKIETLEELSRNETKKISEFENQFRILQEKKQVYVNALNAYKSNIEIPYLSEVESINSIIRDFTSEKNKINSLIDIHNEIGSNVVDLDRLKTELAKLKSRKDNLSKLTVRQELILDKLNKKYRALMKQFNFPDTDEERCYISKENYLPYYSGASVMKHTSGCLLLCMQISYLGAILELNQEEENNCHPSLLMLDTVSNNIGTDKNDKDSVDPITYQEIYKYLIELSQFNQIFIIDNTPPEIDFKHNEFVFHRVSPGEQLKGLIDTTKNEKRR